jgi:hypothetical protein
MSDDDPNVVVMLCRHHGDSTLSCQSLACTRQQPHLQASLATKKQDSITRRFVFLSKLARYSMLLRTDTLVPPSSLHTLHFLVSLLPGRSVVTR